MALSWSLSASLSESESELLESWPRYGMKQTRAARSSAAAETLCGARATDRRKRSRKALPACMHERDFLRRDLRFGCVCPLFLAADGQVLGCGLGVGGLGQSVSGSLARLRKPKESNAKANNPKPLSPQSGSVQVHSRASCGRPFLLRVSKALSSAISMYLQHA